MESDPLLLKASLAFAALMGVAALLPPEVAPRASAPAPVAVAAGDGIELALRDYEAVRESGSALDRCARAHAVALAYLRAGDRAGHQTWESLGARVCAAAGFASEAETAALPAPQSLPAGTHAPIATPRGGGT